MNTVTRFTDKIARIPRTGPHTEEVTRITLLGQMRASGPDGNNVLPRAKKTQAVLAYLCLANGQRLSRSLIAGMVWARSGETLARDSLRHALRELGQVGTWRLEADRGTVLLDTTACWIDAFETPDRPDLLLDNLYGLSPTFDEWLIGERLRFEIRWQTTLEKELNDLTAQDAAPALRAAAARKLLNFVPTHEPGMRSLMTAFAEMDDRAQATREYERFRLVMSSSLGMAPSEKSVALYEAIRLQARAKAAHTVNRNRPSDEPADRAGDLLRASSPPNGATSAEGLQPSLAVLPFRNVSGEPSQGHVVAGLVDDLVEQLSRIPCLFVISRLSAAAFDNEDRPPRDIGEALGARYVLSGSMRVVGKDLRLIVEMTDTTAGKILWIATFDEHLSNLLEVQGRLAERVVRSLAPHLRAAEVKRVRLKRPDHQDAYDLLLQGQEKMHNPSRDVFEASEHLFALAIARDPHYAVALAWRAHWHVVRVGQGWSPDWSHDAAQAEYFAERAVECDAAEPMALAVKGHVTAYFHKDFDLALACFDTALRINPNSARAFLWSAYTYAWVGEGGRAVEHINRAMALSPYDPLVCLYSGGASLAYLADGQYARSIEFALRCMRENRGYTSAHKALILSLVLSGREAEARGPVNRLRLLEPRFTVERFRRRSPACTGRLGDLYCEAFARAGVPVSD